MLLPIAERQYADDTYKKDTAEDKARRAKIKKLIMILVVILTAPAAAACVYFEKMGIFMILISVAFIINTIVGAEKHTINGKTETDLIGLGYLLLAIAGFTIILGISVHFGEDSEGIATDILGLLFLSSIALVIIGRLIYLGIKAAAISKRKRKCTEIVSARYSGYKDYWNLASASGHGASVIGDPIYKYYYEGETYHLTIIENIPARSDKSIELELFVDPEHPERFYSEEFFSRNVRSIKLTIKVAVFLLAVCGALMALVYYSE